MYSAVHKILSKSNKCKEPKMVFDTVKKEEFS